MKGRGKIFSGKVYLLLVVSGFWLVSSLIIALVPLRAHALVPELLDSTTSTVRKVTSSTKLMPALTSLLNPNDSPASGNEIPPASNKPPSTAVSSSSNSTGNSRTATTKSDAASTKSSSSTYPTLALAVSPLETVSLPTTLAATHAGSLPRATLISEGSPRFVLLETSGEGWKFLGVAWYWWLGAIIILMSGAITWRELRRIIGGSESVRLTG